MRIREFSLLVVLGLTWAQGLTGLAPAEKSGRPGAYVTLPFVLEGSGKLTIDIKADRGFTVLSPKRSLALKGRKVLPVTTRIPREALADSIGTITLEASPAGGGKPLILKGRIRVLTVTQVQLSAPTKATAIIGEPYSLRLFVTNLGNRENSVELTARAAAREVLISPNRLVLLPGQSESATVTVLPAGTVSPGYRLLVEIRARSSNDLSVEARRQLLLTYLDARTVRLGTSQDLRLVFSLQSGLVGDYTLQGTKSSFSFGYSVLPSLSGGLSDYIKTSLTSNALNGNESSLVPDAPSRFSLALAANRWDAMVKLAPDNYSLELGSVLGGWQLGSNLSYLDSTGDASFATNLSATSPPRELDLQLSAHYRTNTFNHLEQVSGLYRASLTPSLNLETGLDLNGSAEHQPKAPYVVFPVLRESLSWIDQNLDLRQSYTGLPTAGLHNLGVSGGSRSVYPLGLRASSSYQYSPLDQFWQSSLALYGFPLSNLGLSLRGGYTQGQGGPRWYSYGANINFGLAIWEERVSTSASYHSFKSFTVDTPDSDYYGLNLGVRGSSFSLGTFGKYVVRGSAANRPALTELQAGLSGSYILASQSLLGLKYDYSYTFTEPEGQAHTLVLDWFQYWTPSFSTQLSYQRGLSFLASGTRQSPEQIRLKFGVRNLGLEGLALELGYSAKSEGSLFNPWFTPIHSLSLGIGYTLDLAFKTPRLVSNLFGGRRSGEVYGIAFQDVNLNGLPDPGEPRLAGLTLGLGDQSTQTDQNGRYRLFVPQGTYSFTFGKGLPAILGLTTDPRATVLLNQRKERDLPFAPVTTLKVLLFDDTNHNGVQDPGEPSIPYGGVIINGPVKRTLRVADDGSVFIAGLPAGSYTVRPDPAFLPRQFVASLPTLRVVLNPPAKPVPVKLGAALPKKTLVTTFTPGSLGIFAFTLTPSVPPGGDLRILARTTGGADKVWLDLFGRKVELTQAQTGRWAGSLHIPADTPYGNLQALVVATNATGQRAQVRLRITVADLPLFTPKTFRMVVGQEESLELGTRFKPSRLLLVFSDHKRLELTSSDGYTWYGQLSLDNPGKQRARLFSDGREAGSLEFIIEARK